MSNRFGVYNPLREWKKGDLPCNAAVNIAVHEYSSVKDREILVSANLMTEEEIDYAVNGLIQDLEKVRREAKRTFNKQTQKIRPTLTTYYSPATRRVRGKYGIAQARLLESGGPYSAGDVLNRSSQS